MDDKPVVAIVGRPNVGKSTLFNRLAGGRAAIVQPEPGVTRDRICREAEWNGRRFVLVDTGGVVEKEKDAIEAGIRRQVEQAIEQADLILFVVDALCGVLPEDKTAAGILRRTGKPVILVANKVDSFASPPVLSYEFYALGMGEPFAVSAAQGLNTGDLLDMVVANLPEKSAREEEEKALRVAVVGRPNVGKSSLVNALLGEERAIVSEIPGTTRDAVDTPFERGGKRYLLIDTAGIRRKRRVEMAVERYSIIRAQKGIARAQVAVLVLDAVEGVTAQDKRIAGMAEDSGRAVVIAVNKWDLVPADRKNAARYREAVKEALDFITYAPVVFTVATAGQGMTRLLQAVDKAAANAFRRVPTGELNALMEEAVLRNPPPQRKGDRLKIYYGTQVGENPPVFLLYVNDPGLLHFSYRRYLENQLRSAYDFTGTPIRFAVKRRRKKED
ncbi:MAG TPA: ribosome biogenesis GTPase Der [Desulfotomaculum sp.]|nr:ribosome biogenesis GTPase Der [Desulfotomaculum sp.]